jgi:hypothetical protein
LENLGAYRLRNHDCERVEISAAIVVAIRFPMFTPAASGASTGAWTPAPTLLT